jgi:hypothetical protein
VKGWIGEVKVLKRSGMEFVLAYQNPNGKRRGICSAASHTYEELESMLLNAILDGIEKVEKE